MIQLLTSGQAPVRRVIGSVTGRLKELRARPVWSAAAQEEIRSARTGYHAVHAEHEPHLEAAIEWLCRAQNATGTGGIARGYSLTWNPYFRAAGWQAAYPETTGYIIPTLFHAARRLERRDLAVRAYAAARWEVDVQLPDGAVQGGVIGQARAPAVFNTGQVIFGWLSALEETGEGLFAEATRAAGFFLADALGGDDPASAGSSPFARHGTTLYNARAAWALAEAGVRLGEDEFVDVAHRYLSLVAARQHDNGWIPDACLYDPERPLLHTIAYTVRGLLEGGRLLGDAALLEGGAVAARNLMGAVRDDGWMPGKLDADWEPAASWSCLTGQAQITNNWLRLHEITGDPEWLEPVESVLSYLKSTQNGTSSHAGLRGGIKGSDPLDGEYGRFEVLSWATKFFADALMRHEVALADGRAAYPPVPALA